ncbi:MAG: DUF1684 domain-containing protein [Pseudomonadota bacterium]
MGAMQDYDAWKADRKTALLAEDGWLNLIARLELPYGTYSIGSGSDCALRLPFGPEHIGTVAHGPDGAEFASPGGPPESFKPVPGGFPQLKAPPFLLELHDPGDDPALRVRDLTQPRDVTLDYFPFDPAWVIQAEWKAMDAPQQIEIGQSGAPDTAVTLTHEACFTYLGQAIHLVPTHWKAGKPMFVVRDATSGPQTYAASRFLIAEPTQGGEITLDFNRLHNPPCAFTDHAICPLPPRSNVLPFAIMAGELKPSA